MSRGKFVRILRRNSPAITQYQHEREVQDAAVEEFKSRLKQAKEWIHTAKTGEKPAPKQAESDGGTVSGHSDGGR
jgi:hypothetical protein